jgi:hypothetical protein
MKPLVKAVAVTTLVSTSTLCSSRAIVASASSSASAHHNAASSTQTVVQTKIALAQPSVQTSTTKPGANVTFRASTNKKTYKPGEPVIVTMRVRNVSRAEQVLQFSTARSFDIMVSPQNRTAPIWHWSRGRMFAQMMRDVSLAPGQSQVFTATWNRIGDDDKAVAPGTYQVAARLTTIGAGVEAPPVVITLK